MKKPTLSTKPRFVLAVDLLRPQLRPGQRLLDIGCRDGALRRYLLERIAWEGL